MARTIGVKFTVKDGKADFSVDKLKVFVDENEHATLIWTLDKDQTAWVENEGIVFGPDWRARGLPEPALQPDGSYQVTYENSGGKNGLFKYTINVKQTSNNAVLSFDPEIQNQPPTDEDTGGARKP